jgi:hypothetical protein
MLMLGMLQSRSGNRLFLDDLTVNSRRHLIRRRRLELMSLSTTHLERHSTFIGPLPHAPSPIHHTSHWATVALEYERAVKQCQYDSSCHRGC